jgi:hypothetical protein
MGRIMGEVAVIAQLPKFIGWKDVAGVAIQVTVVNAAVAVWLSGSPPPTGWGRISPFVLANLGLMCAYVFALLLAALMVRIATRLNGGKWASSREEWRKSQRVRWKDMGRAEYAWWAAFLLFSVAFPATVFGLPKAWVLPHPLLVGSIYVLGFLGTVWGIAATTRLR